jgi:hypothetical protein
MRAIQRLGFYADVVEAPSQFDPAISVKLGLKTENFQQLSGRNLATAVAQYYGIVQEGIMSANHLFRGLKRPLMLADDMNADQTVLAYTWRPSEDMEWAGSRFEGDVIRLVPPPGRVFVVLVREEYGSDGVSGSIEHWNWVREDPKLPYAPVDWEQRYGKKLWSRGI